MPSTVADVFAAAGLVPAGPVRWGTPVPDTGQGVYVVALTDDPTSTSAASPTAPLDRTELDELLALRPALRMNLARPDADDLIERLGGFWLPDEVVLYVGLAGQPLRRRVGQYYKTPLGARRPHAGGWWLKTLRVLDELRVYWAATPEYAHAEKRMLRAFARAVSRESRAALLDDERVMPFANLRGHDDRIKDHHITGATGDLPIPASATRRANAPARPASTRPTPAAASVGPQRTRWAPDGRVSQRVTATDLAAGRIRLPRPSKALLPDERADVRVALRGAELRARWDPRTGPPERSGVLAFGRGKLDGRVGPDEVLHISAGRGGQDVQLS
jgi:hypothetical protein